MRLMFCAAAVLLLARNDGATPEPPGRAPSAAEASDGMALFDRGLYLDGLDALADSAGAAGGRPNDFAHQLWYQMRPMIGSYAPPPPLNPGQLPLSEESAAKLRRATAEDALPLIVKAAAGTRVVVLNEAHHSPRHRAFALEVAKALRPLGYTLLAAEAFVNHPPLTASLAREGFPRLKSGTYLKEPVFGDFVRQALGLGYRPIAYEQDAEQRNRGERGIPGREQAQAENLAAALRANPGRKLLVYVGFSHVAEAPIEHGNGRMEWMAARLRKLTGIDPLTIEQTAVAEDSSSRPGREAWAMSAPKLRRTSVLRLDGQLYAFGPYAHAVDLQVVHPPTRLRDGRPVWLSSMGRRPRAIPPALIRRPARRLVQAFLADEPDDAVPVDQVLVEPGQPVPTLMVPAGRIRFAVQEPRVSRRAP
ncbi:MAG TPA: hypothetical protein VEA61_13015 [Allosphingosinicella sp.]|nr:hypothetical protein [Allosphingosinicella sp.]